MQKELQRFFHNLGFDSDTDFSSEDHLSAELGGQALLRYSLGEVMNLYFIYLSEDDFPDSLLKTHQIVWNDNKTEVFIIISDHKTYLCASKYKPDTKTPKKCVLESFDYGVNSPEFSPDAVRQLLKENIDYGFFWEFVRGKLKEKRRRGVDDDLLLNLVLLKHDLKEQVAEEKTYILIERCLFLKFLEDRNFLHPHTLLDILQAQDGSRLVEKFNTINALLNGDIFYEEDFSVEDFLNPCEALSRLAFFFTTDYTNQIQLFPYNFSILPIELLSNIYEAFLKLEEKIAGGVYYTPSILVDLLLDETLTPSLQINPFPTCLDFSCGSGIFLVKAYERLIQYHTCSSDFNAKKEILKHCIFGIEKDIFAARITIFSLYLKLLEGENAENIRRLIQADQIKFPRLLNKNIQCKNTLFDSITFNNEDGKPFKTFDVLVGNPPWGVNPYNDPDLPDNPEMQLSQDKRDAVTPYQSSQYFTLKAQDFMSKGAIAGILTNNSNLLTSTSQVFRQCLLQNYDVKTIYDFTHCNSILFKKKKLKLPLSPSLTIELGADIPPIALILKIQSERENSTLNYIRPSLGRLSKFLKVIWIKSSDETKIPKQLLENKLVWKILAVGEFEDYQLSQKLNLQKGEISLEGYYGIRFKKNGKPVWRNIEYLDKDCIDHFITKGTKRIDNKGESIRRPGRFYPNQLLVYRKVTKELRVKATYDSKGMRFKDNLIGIRCPNYDYRLLLALFNSSLMSYFLFYNSSQIGSQTFDMLNKNELESIPIPILENISHDILTHLTTFVDTIRERGEVSHAILEKIDESVFKIFHLKDHEKQRIKDFFSVIKRKDTPQEFVNHRDFYQYAQRFRHVFTFILKDNKFLNAEAFVSSLVGAGITFRIVDMDSKQEEVSMNPTSDIAKIIPQVAKRHLQQSEKIRLLKQEKLKFYHHQSFTIIKSNYYKDWTETEAIKDAKEEIELFIQHLPEK